MPDQYPYPKDNWSTARMRKSRSIREGNPILQRKAGELGQGDPILEAMGNVQKRSDPSQQDTAVYAEEMRKKLKLKDNQVFVPHGEPWPDDWSKIEATPGGHIITTDPDQAKDQGRTPEGDWALSPKQLREKGVTP